MCPDHGDTALTAELVDLNLGFLTLITAPDAPGLGLEAAIVEQLRTLRAQERAFIAGTPGLLACFRRLPPSALQRVAEAQPALAPVESAWRESARLYVTGLLTWLRQLEQHEPPCCALCAVSRDPAADRLAHLDFSRIRASADLAVDELRARFGDHPTFWADLIRSARSGDEDYQALSRLRIIPLVLAEQCASRR